MWPPLYTVQNFDTQLKTIEEEVREIRDKEREKENEIDQGDEQESSEPVNEYTEEVGTWPGHYLISSPLYYFLILSNFPNEINLNNDFRYYPMELLSEPTKPTQPVRTELPFSLFNLPLSILSETLQKQHLMKKLRRITDKVMV